MLPINGAQIYDFGAEGVQAFNALTIDRLTGLPYATDSFVYDTGSELNGHVIAVQTTNGNYAKAYVIEKDYNLSLYYVLFRKWRF